MARRERDEDYGLTPREWLESDPVPLTPDIDFNDPEQRIAWIRANNEENYARSLDLAARRNEGAREGSHEGSHEGSRTDGSDGGGGSSRRSTTTVIAVRVPNAEQRALVRVARRQNVIVSDLVRRWVRAGLEQANAIDPEALDPDEREEQRQALRDAADDAVGRIADEVRRLREIVVAGG